MGVDPRVVEAELRAQTALDPRQHDQDLGESERRVREELRRARARQWRRRHWWGAGEEDATGA